LEGLIPPGWNSMSSLSSLDVRSNLGLTGEIPELLHNKYFIGDLDLRADGTSLVPPTTPVRTCSNGLELYLPYLVRSYGPGNKFAVDCSGMEASLAGSSIPAWIGAVTGLTKLNLFNNNLEGTLPTGLGLLTEMDQL
jgi:hypothetical protein